MKQNLIYFLSVEDAQNVANQVLGRSLNEKEIALVKKNIAEKINWFDAIETAILENIDSSMEKRTLI